MALPQLKTPTYMLTVPSTKEKIEFRPFVTKEEKILLMAKQSGDEDQILSAMKNLVSVCTFEKVSVGNASIFDLEYVFTQLRARSIGEESIVKFKCTNQIPVFETSDRIEGDDFAEDDTGKVKECGGEIILTIKFLDVNVTMPEGHTNTFIVDKADGIGFKLNYPCVNMKEELEKLSEIDFDKQVALLCECIFDNKSVYPATDTPRDELEKFFEGIGRPVYREIKEKFFDLMPTVELKVDYKCGKCGHEDTYIFRGIKDFF